MAKLPLRGKSVERSLGAILSRDGKCHFRVWAPLARRVELEIVSPCPRRIGLEKREKGYFEAEVDGVCHGTLYTYCIDEGRGLPDPASRFQPQGVHGPSQVVDNDFSWEDEFWHPPSLDQYVIYEIHVGTLTSEGTFEAAIRELRRLKDLGITAVELMPVAQFPGERNWGYDGVFPFAVQSSYGGPNGLKRLVNACHREGLAVILDVVFNHVGPEGNYLDRFAPYHADRYQTPWGAAINFDGAFSDGVREFFIQNALYWTYEFHIDSLRLDALHAIVDLSPRHFFEELATRVHAESKRLKGSVYLIAESAQNDVRLVKPARQGGFELDAMWSDDFHHALHTALTDEQTGYYRDFRGLCDLAKAMRQGFVYTGQYSEYRKRSHGTKTRGLSASNFVVFSQNHDQVGNRAAGERLGSLVSFDGLKLAAGVELLSPFVPLLFMGEEYGETAPFLYFTDHSDTALVAAVREGRRKEFSSLAQSENVSDPQDPETFRRSKLHRNFRSKGSHRVLTDFYRELIRLRIATPALRHPSMADQEILAFEKAGQVFIHRWHESDQTVILMSFARDDSRMAAPMPRGTWRTVLDSSDLRWLGPGTRVADLVQSDGEVTIEMAPFSVVMFQSEVS